MAFPEMQPWQYPPRLWALEGYPGSGKSTFAAQMVTPILVVDADHRYREVLRLVDGPVYELSKNPIDHIDTNHITAALMANMPGTRVGTIVVDSLTAILEPLIVQAMMDKETGKVKNQMAGWKTKALAMRQLQDAVTRWGSDVLWIYHLRKTRDANARDQVRTSVTDTELERLKRCINLRLQILEQDGQRAVKVLWARRGRAGMTIPDDSGTWAGMPAKIEAAVYDGPGQGDKQALRAPQAEKRPAESPAPEGMAGRKADEALVPCYADGSPVSSN
ncbi:MAG: hypothetical protein EHM56_07250, partial [Chloroflexi bacterium]